MMRALLAAGLAALVLSGPVRWIDTTGGPQGRTATPRGRPWLLFSIPPGVKPGDNPMWLGRL